MRTLKQTVNTQQLGFSLVELMVALAISGFLMLGLVRVFDSNRQNTLLSDSFARVQESGRISQTMLTRSLRMLGFTGCAASTAMAPATGPDDDIGFWSNLDTSDPDYDPLLADYSTTVQAIDNFDGTDATTYAGVFGTYSDGSDIIPVTDSDVLIIRSAQGMDLTIGKNMGGGGAAAFQVAGPESQYGDIEEGDVVLITDCDTYARLISVTNNNPKNKTVTTNTGNCKSSPTCINNDSQDLPNVLPGDQILRMQTEGWFVAQSEYFQDSKGNPVNSLFVSDRTSVAQEMVPFVEDLQFEYAVDSTSPTADDIVDGYFTATELEKQIAGGTAPTGITSVSEYITQRGFAVRMQVVVSGEYDLNSPLVTEAMTSRGNGDYPADGRLRKVYSSVSQIRNNPTVGDLLSTGT